MDCSSATRATILFSRRARSISWISSYALTRRLHHTLQKIMLPLVEGKCPLDSDLHEPTTGCEKRQCWRRKCAETGCIMVLSSSRRRSMAQTVGLPIRDSEGGSAPLRCILQQA
ncbi:hypothetical protein VPH35_107937 [Triticum aestivum]